MNDMANTVITTIEITDICDSNNTTPDGTNVPKVTADEYRTLLNADDVVITKVQIFEGTDEEE